MKVLIIFVCFGVGVLADGSRTIFPLLPNNGAQKGLKGVPFVSGGASVALREASWHAGLYKKTSTPYMQICGGTVIANNVVVTAAHCFSQNRQIPPASDYAVAAGKIYRPWNDTHDTGAQKSDVKEVKIPPRYQGSMANFQHDIALVILTKEFLFNVYVRPACLSFSPDFDEAQLQEGQLGKVAGWGLTEANGRASQVLQAARLPSVSIDKCIEQSPVGFRSSITGDKICAGYNNGTAVCRGDSGGGLVFLATLNLYPRYFLRGVVSTSPSSENTCNIYTWATFTHVLRHEHFIKSVVPDVEETCVPKSTDGKVELRFGRTNELIGNKRCDCECPSTRGGK